MAYKNSSVVYMGIISRDEREEELTLESVYGYIRKFAASIKHQIRDINDEDIMDTLDFDRITVISL